MHPVSFLEYLEAHDEEILLNILTTATVETPPLDAAHNRLMQRLQEYFFVGGMPASIQTFLQTKSLLEAQSCQQDILRYYRTDFAKYAKHSADYSLLQEIFEKGPFLVGKQFKYVSVNREIKSYLIKRSLQKLYWAGLFLPIYSTAANGIPLRAEINKEKFKLLLLDLGLLQTAMGTDPSLFHEENLTLIHNGALAEQFVGQEIVAYENPRNPGELFFWDREKAGSSAEIDYLLSSKSRMVPIEVKAGSSGKLKSLKLFMKEKNCPLGVRICSDPLSFEQEAGILTVPFYLVSQLERLL